ncbi:MAG: ribosome-binding factor A [Magnetovibrio sp.]|nr:ribosome-binding factor A [Magnetovibrio sp.]|tara:strand:- start:737 stop:1159 length:423 start_codon:yes stop_codon:yes gene_type:complete
MSKHQAKAPSQRQLKVGEEIRHILAWILERGEVHDPAVSNKTLTVTEVSVSPDLKAATAYVIALGSNSDEMGEALLGLNRAKSFLRRCVAERLQLRHAPKLNFSVDTSFDKAGRIDTLLHLPEVARDLDKGSTNGDKNGS